MEEQELIQNFVDLFDNSDATISVDGNMVTINSDSFTEVPATGEKPECIYVSTTSAGGLDVRPVGSGGERMEVMPKDAAEYIDYMFFSDED